MKKENLSKSGQEITRVTTCPCFAGRKSLLAIEPICWFCKYAGFDLRNDKLPEKGTCYYPVEQEERSEKDETIDRDAAGTVQYRFVDPGAGICCGYANRPAAGAADRGKLRNYIH